MLATQSKMLASSKQGSARSRAIQAGVGSVRRAITQMAKRVEGLVGFSGRAVSTAERSASSSDRLAATLRELRALFTEVMRESRELNRKARGYDELRDGPG
jgi:hypothetical protein